MNRIAVIRARCEVLGLVDGPTDAELDALVEEEVIEDDISVEKAERVSSDDELTEDEEFEALTYLMGEKSKAPADMPRISDKPLSLKKVVRKIPLTEGLIDQMVALGIDPKNARDNGNRAISLIQRKGKKTKEQEKVAQQKKEAVSNFCRSLMKKSNANWLDMLVDVDDKTRIDFLKEVIESETYIY